VDMHARLMTHPGVAGARALSGVDALAGVIGETATHAFPGRRAVSGHQAPPKLVHNRWKGMRRLASYMAVAAATLAATILVQVAWRRPQRPVAVVSPVAPLVYVATLSQA